MKRTPRSPGQRLLDWRTEKGWTQLQAAEAIGVTQATWSEWENDNKSPRIEHAVRIEKLTVGECPVEMFIGEMPKAANGDG